MKLLRKQVTGCTLSKSGKGKAENIFYQCKYKHRESISAKQCAPCSSTYKLWSYNKEYGLERAAFSVNTIG